LPYSKKCKGETKIRKNKREREINSLPLKQKQKHNFKSTA
jgi:hypothetical protein